LTADVSWFPHSLHPYAADGAELRESWCYVVLEEIVDRTALLLRWPWPLADAKGRLFWPAADQDRVSQAGISVSVLERQLYKRRLRRSPRIGDTFAMRMVDDAAWREGATVDDARELLPDLVLDVSADAREAAKLAYQGSLVPPVPSEQLEAALVRKSTQDRLRTTVRPLLRPADRSGDGTEGERR
jgi:hypothetical protein